MRFDVEDHPDPADIELLERESVRRRRLSRALVTRSSWRSSCATQAPSSPASAVGPGAIAASCRVCGLSPVSEVAGWRLGCSPPRRRKRRRGGAHRRFTSPTTSKPQRSTSRPATNSWHGSGTFHPDRMPSGTASVSTRAKAVPGVGVEPTRPLGQRILSPSRLPFRHPGRSGERSLAPMTDGSGGPPRQGRSRLLTAALVVLAVGGAREWAFARNRRRYGSPPADVPDRTR